VARSPAPTRAHGARARIANHGQSERYTHVEIGTNSWLISPRPRSILRLATLDADNAPPRAAARYKERLTASATSASRSTERTTSVVHQLMIRRRGATRWPISRSDRLGPLPVASIRQAAMSRCAEGA
jgi:hypothetical protein